MPKSGAYHHGNLRATLMALARETLEQDGPEAIALRDLAERAGVSNMAPYRHFADKAALFEAVAAQGFAELKGELIAVDDAADPAKALIAFGVAYVRFASARPGLFRLMYGGLVSAPAASPGDDSNDLQGLFAQRLGQLLPPPEVRLAFLACWSIVHGFASLLVSGHIRPPVPQYDEVAERLGDVLIRGLLA